MLFGEAEMTPRIIVTIVALLTAASSFAPVAGAQDQAQIEKCQGGWAIQANDKVSACTALIDGEQLTGADVATVFYLRGSAFKELGAFDKAIADLSEAIRLAPDSPNPYAMRGGVFNDTEKFDEAIADFDQAIRLDPTDGYTFQQRGDAYESKDMHARAIADYDETVRLDPTDDFALSTRCKVRANWGRQLEQALKDCSEAISLGDDDEYAYEQRGLVHLRLGQYREAIADYGEALKGYAGRTESLYGRGIAKLRNGDADGGKEDIATATGIDAGIAKTFADWGVKP
jgi:tetratricopeptide (TPR) repeat protein